MDPVLPWVLVAAPFIGSFLGTLVLRLPAGAPVLVARSRCPACGHVLSFREMLPLAAWVLQRGRCRHCAAPIGIFYPAMETAALGVAVWAATETAGVALIASCVLGWGLLALAVTDRRCFLLPDALTMPLLGLGLASTAWFDGAALGAHGLAALLGWLGFILLARLYRSLRGRDGLGLGDAKLLAGGAAWVGPAGVPGAVLVASLLGLCEVAFARLRRGAPLPGTMRIAFGTWLAVGLWLVWLYGPLSPA